MLALGSIFHRYTPVTGGGGGGGVFSDAANNHHSAVTALSRVRSAGRNCQKHGNVEEEMRPISFPDIRLPP